MKRVLIVGGGFIAKSIACQLGPDQDVSVVTPREIAFSRLVRSSKVYRSFYDFKAEKVHPNMVIFCTGPSSLNLSEVAANKFKTELRQALRYSSDVGVDAFVYMSSGGAIYQPSTEPLSEVSPLDADSAYACFHRDCEKMLQSQEPIRNKISLRLGNPFGKFQNPARSVGFVSMALRSAYLGTELTIIGNGLISRDFFHVSLLGNFLRSLRLQGSGYEVYNFGSGVSESLLSIVERVSRITGRKIDVAYLPVDSVRRPVVRLDISKLRRDFGIQEHYDLDRAIFSFANEYLSMSYEDLGVL